MSSTVWNTSATISTNTSANTSTNTSANTSDNLTFTGIIDRNDMWFPYYLESTWLPYDIISYKPKWHITQGYKTQLLKMWN